MTDFPHADSGRPEDLEDLLAGRGRARPLDDRLRAALRNLRSDLTRPSSPETSQRHLAQIHEAARTAAHSVTSPRYGWRTRLGQLAAATTVKVVIGTTAAAAATGGLAATGNLPAPAQRVASTVAATVGVRLPADTKLNRNAELEADDGVPILQAAPPELPTAELTSEPLGPAKTPQVPEGLGGAQPGAMSAETPPAQDVQDSGSAESDPAPTSSDAPIVPAPTTSEDTSGSASCTTSPDTSGMDEDSSTSADTAPEPAPSTSEDTSTDADGRTPKGKAIGHEKQGIAEGTGTSSVSSGSEDPEPAPTSTETSSETESTTTEDPCVDEGDGSTSASSTGSSEVPTDDDSEPEPYEGSGSAVAPSDEES